MKGTTPEALDKSGFDRESAIFPQVVLGFIRDTKPEEWAKLEALHGAKAGELIQADLCNWMDANGALATLRHGSKCFGRTPRTNWLLSLATSSKHCSLSAWTRTKRSSPAT